MNDFNHWLLLPDGTALDLYAPGVRLDIDFGIYAWPNYETGFMEYKHTGYNRMTVRIGGESTRYGFVGPSRFENGIVQPNYNPVALERYTSR